MPYTRNESAWTVSTKYQSTTNFSEVEQQFLNCISANSNLLFDFIKKYNLQSKLYIVLRINVNDPPIITMSRELISFSHYFGAKVEFDTYYGK